MEDELETFCVWSRRNDHNAIKPHFTYSKVIFIILVSTFYYKRWFFCWNKILSFSSEANVIGVIKNLFLLLGAKKKDFFYN